jgi:hypothetical protein
MVQVNKLSPTWLSASSALAHAADRDLAATWQCSAKHCLSAVDAASGDSCRHCLHLNAAAGACCCCCCCLLLICSAINASDAELSAKNATTACGAPMVPLRIDGECSAPAVATPDSTAAEAAANVPYVSDIGCGKPSFRWAYSVGQTSDCCSAALQLARSLLESLQPQTLHWVTASFKLCTVHTASCLTALLSALLPSYCQLSAHCILSYCPPLCSPAVLLAA